MKYLLVVLVMAAVACADGTLRFWEDDDTVVDAISNHHWVTVLHTEMTDIDYFWVYSTDSLALVTLECKFVYGYPDSSPYLSLTHDVESCSLGFRMRVDPDDNPLYGHSSTMLFLNGSLLIRATEPAAGKTYKGIVGGTTWILAPYESNVIFVGQVVSLDRTTWAEIKTSF